MITLLIIITVALVIAVPTALVALRIRGGMVEPMDVHHEEEV